MPQVHIPNTDDDRSELLRSCIVTGQFDAGTAPPRIFLAEGRVQEVLDFYNDSTDPAGVPVTGFRNLVKDLTEKRGKRSIESGQSERAEAVLETYIRDYHEVLKRRTFRLAHPVAVFGFFNWPQDGSAEPISNRADRRIQALAIIDGEAAMVAAGFPAMSNPSRQEIADKLTLAETELLQITPTDRAVEEALEKVRAVRPRANELIADILDDLRYHTRKLPAGTARDAMRTYGVQFDLLPGEESDPVTPPAEGSNGGGTPPPTP